jgi:hypothetical protein
MELTPASVRRTARRMGGRALRYVAGRNGYAVIPKPDAGAEPPASQAASDTVAIPRGAGQPFTTDEYEVVPKGRYDVVISDFYSPVPNLELLPDDIWERRRELAGIDLGIEAAIAMVEDELAPFVRELEVPTSGPLPPGEFYLNNGNYEALDAELLYAIVRAKRPRRVVELGSGYTTLLIGQAARRNGEDGVETEHLAYDPYPRAQIFGEEPPPPTRFEPLPATEVPLEHFRQLEAGDVLFVDTTHTVKLGSDVNHIILDVLPTLAPGVIVHFHDIFMPWEYPRVWFEEMSYFWAEQYLLEAFLSFNDSFRVLLPAEAVAREHPQRVEAVVPSFVAGRRPGAFWIERL